MFKLNNKNKNTALNALKVINTYRKQRALLFGVCIFPLKLFSIPV